MKRPRLNRSIVSDHSIKKVRSHLEDISNELIYEMFDYLDYQSIVDAFWNLNVRFQKLLLHPSFRIKIYVPLIRQEKFEEQRRHLLQIDACRVISLHVSQSFLTWFTFDLFPNLEYLYLQQLQWEQVQKLLQHLSSLAHLRSLIIETINYFQDENRVYRKILSIRTLKFVRLQFPSGGQRIPLSLCHEPNTLLERLIIQGPCRLEQLISILSYTKKLRYLSCERLNGYDRDTVPFSRLTTELQYVSLKIYQIPFQQIEQFLSVLSNKLHRLRIIVDHDQSYFQANQWQTLIENSMPRLTCFDFDYVQSADENDSIVQNRIASFTSPFWIEHGFQFAYDYYLDHDGSFLKFYSLVPYRSPRCFYYSSTNSDFQRYSQLSLSDNDASQVISSTSLKSYKSSIRFHKLKELMLRNNDLEMNPQFIQQIADVIPLHQLTKLRLQANSLQLDQLHFLLLRLSNLHTVILSNTSSINCCCPNQELLHAPKLHHIKWLIIDDSSCSHQQFRSLIQIFPSLEYLELSIDESIMFRLISWLCSTSNKCHFKSLVALLLLNISYEAKSTLQTLLNKDEQFNHFQLQRITGGWHVWW